MRTVLLSSAYLPPVSFFSAMAGASDVIIEQYDSYCKQTYRNRCLIAGANGIQTLTIPIIRPSSPGQPMKDVRISDHGEWRHQHWNALESAYMNTPYYMYYQDDFRPFYEKKWEFLLDFNMELTQVILKLAHMSVQLSLTDSYYNNPDDITDLRILVNTMEQSSNAKPYWQVFQQKHGFLPNLSAVDLLFNMGPEFKTVL